MHGILLVDKPEGMTSNDVVRILKRLIKPAKVGHTGTLDPAASGLMVMLIGAGTRVLDYLNESPKSYALRVYLGEETDTHDAEGAVVRSCDSSKIQFNDVEEVLKRYRGLIHQVPPHFSAIKREGVPLYKLARKGIFPDLSPRKVEICSLTITRWEAPFLDLDMICSRGTYARAVARDIGRDLGVGGRIDKLRRNACGQFHITDAVTLDEIVKEGPESVGLRLIKLASALSHIPDVQASPSEMVKLMRGVPVCVAQSRLHHTGSAGPTTQQLFKVAANTGDLLILTRPVQRATEVALHPIKVFNMA
jgi:tRNA pseudouridine55 synthase